jgi:hypothetical protein
VPRRSAPFQIANSTSRVANGTLGEESHYHAAGAAQRCADRPENRRGGEPQSAGKRLYRRPCGARFLRVLRGWVFRFSGRRRRSLYGPPPISTTAIGPVYGIPQNIWYSVDGHIAFHMVDAKSNKTIWTSVETKKIRDLDKGMKNMPKQVEQMCLRLSRSFPQKTSKFRLVSYFHPLLFSFRFRGQKKGRPVRAARYCRSCIAAFFAIRVGNSVMTSTPCYPQRVARCPAPRVSTRRLRTKHSSRSKY